MRFDTPPMSPVPAHSPYRLYQWVRCHGHPGDPLGPRRWGFRGYVLGTLGGTTLRGLTDDGHEWAECWGALRPDGPNTDAVVCCTCCPRNRPKPRRRPRRARTPIPATPEQLAALWVPDPDQMPLFELGRG
jgi:hypothetical protein